MTPDTILDFARSVLPPDAYPAFSEHALWAAGESQKATAIPALTLVAALSLLVVVAWIGAVAAVVRWVRGLWLRDG